MTKDTPSTLYNQRKIRLAWAKFRLAFFVGCFILALNGMIVAETFLLNILNLFPWNPLIACASMSLLLLSLGAFPVVLCHLALYVTFYTQRVSLTKTSFLTFFLMIFGGLSHYFQIRDILLYLAFSQGLAVLLLFRFWRFYFTELRLRNCLKSQTWLSLPIGQSLKIAVWPICGCILLSVLGLTLSVMRVWSIIPLQTWEGGVLLVAFYLVFRKLVASPASSWALDSVN